jgi:hypothetical protein
MPRAFIRLSQIRHGETALPPQPPMLLRADLAQPQSVKYRSRSFDFQGDQNRRLSFDLPHVFASFDSLIAWP